MTGFFIIEPVIYPAEVLVSICQTDERLRKYRSLWWGDPDTTHCFDIPAHLHGRTIDLGNGQIVMRFLKWPLSQGFIAHEFSHATWYILDRIGYVPTPENNEPFAYLLDYLIDQFYLNLQNLKK